MDTGLGGSFGPKEQLARPQRKTTAVIALVLGGGPRANGAARTDPYGSWRRGGVPNTGPTAQATSQTGYYGPTVVAPCGQVVAVLVPAQMTPLGLRRPGGENPGELMGGAHRRLRVLLCACLLTGRPVRPP
eukprot:5724800-Pyramimonas_sp.AAC.1